MFNNKKVKECNTFFSRLFGFMFKKNSDYILKFDNCNSIHTFFMIRNIDVYMFDKHNKLLYKYLNVKPFRIILPKKKVKTIYEILK
ncbi:MAG: hypothetical protein WCS56_04770 [Bacilli bacterium]